MKLLKTHPRNLACKWLLHNSSQNNEVKLPCLYDENERVVSYVYFFSLEMLLGSDYSERTIPTYVENIKGFLNYVLETEDTTGLTIDEAILLINNFQIDEYFIQLRRLNKGDAYLSAIDASLKTFFDWLEGNVHHLSKSKALYENPYKAGKYRTVKSKSRSFRGLTKEQLSIFLMNESLPYCYKIALVFALCTGVRRTELCLLKVSALKAAKFIGEKNLVELNVPNIKERGKNCSERPALLPWSLWEKLMLFIDGNKSDTYVFRNTRGEELTSKAISAMVLRTAKSLEQSQMIDHRVTIHKFRHTFAFMFISYNEGYYSSPVQIELAKMLGHSSYESVKSYTEIPVVRLMSDRKMNFDAGFTDMYLELDSWVHKVLSA